MTVPQVRGTVLLMSRAYVEQRHGAAAYEQLLSRMKAANAAVMRGILLAHDWYPAGAMLEFDDLAAERFGPEHYEETSAFQAEYDLRFIHRFLLKFTSPLWLLERGAKLWREYHNTGEWRVERGQAPHSLVGTLSNWAIVHAGQCRGNIGFIRRAGQLTGAKDIQVEHPQCRAAGARACVFTASW